MKPHSCLLSYLFFEYLAAFLLTSVAVIRKHKVCNGYRNSPHDESGFGSQLALYLFLVDFVSFSLLFFLLGC